METEKSISLVQKQLQFKWLKIIAKPQLLVHQPTTKYLINTLKKCQVIDNKERWRDYHRSDETEETQRLNEMWNRKMALMENR